MSLQTSIAANANLFLFADENFDIKTWNPNTIDPWRWKNFILHMDMYEESVRHVPSYEAEKYKGAEQAIRQEIVEPLSKHEEVEGDFTNGLFDYIFEDVNGTIPAEVANGKNAQDAKAAIDHWKEVRESLLIQYQFLILKKTAGEKITKEEIKRFQEAIVKMIWVRKGVDLLTNVSGAGEFNYAVLYAQIFTMELMEELAEILGEDAATVSRAVLATEKAHPGIVGRTMKLLSLDNPVTALIFCVFIYHSRGDETKALVKWAMFIGVSKLSGWAGKGLDKGISLLIGKKFGLLGSLPAQLAFILLVCIYGYDEINAAAEAVVSEFVAKDSPEREFLDSQLRTVAGYACIPLTEFHKLLEEQNVIIKNPDKLVAALSEQMDRNGGKISSEFARRWNNNMVENDQDSPQEAAKRKTAIIDYPFICRLYTQLYALEKRMEQQRETILAKRISKKSKRDEERKAFLSLEAEMLSDSAPIRNDRYVEYVLNRSLTAEHSIPDHDIIARMVKAARANLEDHSDHEKEMATLVADYDGFKDVFKEWSEYKETLRASARFAAILRGLSASKIRTCPNGSDSPFYSYKSSYSERMNGTHTINDDMFTLGMLSIGLNEFRMNSFDSKGIEFTDAGLRNPEQSAPSSGKTELTPEERKGLDDRESFFP